MPDFFAAVGWQSAENFLRSALLGCGEAAFGRFVVGSVVIAGAVSFWPDRPAVTVPVDEAPHHGKSWVWRSKRLQSWQRSLFFNES